MPKFSEILSALSSPFKTLPQATAALEPAKATLDSVAALFTAAGLNLETMLAAGPDSLKAHLASLDNSAEVTRLGAELSTAKTDLAAAVEKNAQNDSLIITANGILKEIGLANGITSATRGAELKAAFDSHVAKQTTLALAKTGHPPAHVPAAVETVTPVATDAELAAEYTKLDGQARLDFYTKHEVALNRFAKTRRESAA